MAATIKIVLIGATGETGVSIVDALLASSNPKFEITSLTRPSSLEKPEVFALKQRGVNIASFDVKGPLEEVVKTLSGIDVIVSAITAAALKDQIPLANAAKQAGVKRFVPCTFATVAPPRGVMHLRELKEDIIDQIKKIYLPYTIIDVGWWYQLSIPKLPSGRNASVVLSPVNSIPGDGTVSSARTDIRDIGKYVARIVVDPRTLNKYVFAYDEVLSDNEVYDITERVSGEKIERNYISAEELEKTLVETQKALASNPADYASYTKSAVLEYTISIGIRGDNTPESAKYLGYLDGKELYPDVQYIKLEDYIQETLDGKAKRPYNGKLPVLRD